MCSVSHVQHFATPWTVAQQALLSVGLSRQEYWSGLPFPPQGELPNPGIEPESAVSPALALHFLPLSHLRSPQHSLQLYYIISRLMKLIPLESAHITSTHTHMTTTLPQ